MKKTDYRDILHSLEQVKDPATAHKIFGPRAYEAWQSVKERQVKKYIFKPSGKVQWIVVGKQREYLIYEKVGFCSCDDFFFEVMEGKALACQHLIAWKLAEILNMYDTVEEDDELFDSLLEEWKSPN